MREMYGRKGVLKEKDLHVGILAVNHGSDTVFPACDEHIQNLPVVQLQR